MSFKRSLKRFAHISGYTYVTYSENGEQIITSGSNDGDIRIWKEISDDDPANFCIGETAVCCGQYTSDDNKPRLIAAVDNNTVQCFLFPNGDRDGVLLRFTAAVTAINISNKWIAVGSEDFTLKVQKRERTDEYIELLGHTGPILHIDVSSKNMLASSSGDGTIKVWNLENSVKGTTEVLKTFDGFETVNEFSAATVFSTPSFDPRGQYLAFPKSSSIHVIDTASWETKFKLLNSALTGSLTVCRISSCGTWIAAGSSNGEICLWDFTDRSLLKGHQTGEDSHGITAIAWNPKNNGELAFCDNDGQLSSVTVISGKEDNFYVDEAIEDQDEEVADDVDDIYGAIDTYDDASNEGGVSLDKLKSETLKREEEHSEDEIESVKSVIRPFVKSFEIQHPFQPGSTPVNLEHRFMVWNHVGQVMCHSSDENSIIAEFHDVTIHPSLHILNSLNHEMASLSTTCLALATNNSPCRLVVIAFVSSGSKEWTTTMPECEEIKGVAAGEKFVAISTDAGFIRFFTTMGTQRDVISVPGPVVALSAWENLLAVAYHTSSTKNRFFLMIVTLRGPSIISRQVDVPLAAKSKLVWLGFSDTGSIIVHDSSGRVSSYSLKKNMWIPICDLSCHTVGASDNFFIVSVSENSQKIRASLCRGTNYPLTNPRPIVREIDYSLPLCYMENEKSQLEDALVRASNFNVDASEKVIVEKGLKLFSSALNSELESRAFELVELMGSKKLIELAARYASQKGRIHLASKISKLHTDFEEKEKQKEALLNHFEQEIEASSEVYEMQTPKAAEKRFQETSTPLIAPKVITKQKLNPFRKSGTNVSKSTPTSLTHLTNKSIGYNQDSTKSDGENIPSNNVTACSANKSFSMDTPRPGSFGTWFIANKAELAANNPQLLDVDLMKVGKNLYKELTQKQKLPGDVQNTGAVNKRKLNLNEDENGGLAKLAKFGFVDDK